MNGHLFTIISIISLSLVSLTFGKKQMAIIMPDAQDEEDPDPTTYPTHNHPDDQVTTPTSWSTEYEVETIEPLVNYDPSEHSGEVVHQDYKSWKYYKGRYSGCDSYCYKKIRYYNRYYKIVKYCCDDSDETTTTEATTTEASTEKSGSCPGRTRCRNRKRKTCDDDDDCPKDRKCCYDYCSDEYVCRAPK